MNLPKPGALDAPKYWMYETGGELGPAMRRYIDGENLTIGDVSLICAYLRQWFDSAVWDQNPYLDSRDKLDLDFLRRLARLAHTKEHIDSCVRAAVSLGMGPL